MKTSISEVKAKLAPKMRSSPRPSFDGPTHIPYANVTRHVWGDRTSGEVLDWIYVSSDKIHSLVFGLGPGCSFRHSEAHRTVFAADEVFYVLSGRLVLTNPATGEVRKAERAQAIFFRRDTWHHGFNASTEQLRVLEFFAPPPAQGTSSAYARTKPFLEHALYAQDHLIGRWPEAKPESERGSGIQVLEDRDILWRVEGRESRVLVGILVSTEHLTVGKVHLLPGQQTDIQIHGGDKSIYVEDGSVVVRVRESEAKPWFELNPGDGFYLPQGTSHSYANMSDHPTTLLFGVAPSYFPNEGGEGRETESRGQPHDGPGS